jgi:hypothetical protein
VSPSHATSPMDYINEPITNFDNPDPNPPNQECEDAVRDDGNDDKGEDGAGGDSDDECNSRVQV